MTDLQIPDPEAVASPPPPEADVGLKPPSEVGDLELQMALANMEPDRKSRVSGVPDILGARTGEMSNISPVVSEGPYMVPLYNQQGDFGWKISTSLRAMYIAGWRPSCPLCGSHHLRKHPETGVTEFDIRPGACPEVDDPAYGKCPFCAREIFAVANAPFEPKKGDEREGYIPLKLVTDSTKKGLILNNTLVHCIAKHPQESLGLSDIPDHVKTQIQLRLQGGR